MVDLTMTEEEGKLLLGVLQTYHSHLELEIHRTYRREFRDALKEREEALLKIVERLKAMVKPD